MSDVKPLFLRVRESEMRQLDMQAIQAMRSRANYVATKVAAVLSGAHEEPTYFPDPAPASESLILFVRVPVGFKQDIENKAKEAGVPLSRYLRGLLFPTS